MSMTDELRKALIDKFRRLYEGTQGGIFRSKTRERILTGEGISLGDTYRNQFWYRHRENVKTALIDLQLFVELAGRSNVNQVVTWESLTPIVSALLKGFAVGGERDMNRAEMAQMFVQRGLEYLREMNPDMSLVEIRTIDEATDLSKRLVRATHARISELRRK